MVFAPEGLPLARDGSFTAEFGLKMNRCHISPRTHVSLYHGLGFIFLIALFLSAPDGAGGEVLPALAEQVVGGEFTHAVQRGDSLTSIGARFGVSVNWLAARNNLAPNARLKIGERLQVNNRHIVPPSSKNGIIINIPQRMLFYFREGKLIHAFPAALGRPGWPSPTGSFTVVAKELDPTWNVPQSIQEEMRREGHVIRTCVPPGPDNPLGKHWLGLSLGGYGIHGTNVPASIYHFQTHGCIRLHPDDMARLFQDVSIGTSGLLIYQRLSIARVGQQIYLEVGGDIYNREKDIRSPFDGVIASHNLESAVDRKLAEAIIRRQDGIAQEITRGLE